MKLLMVVVGLRENITYFTDLPYRQCGRTKAYRLHGKAAN
jgi:hypothetical protein